MLCAVGVEGADVSGVPMSTGRECLKLEGVAGESGESFPTLMEHAKRLGNVHRLSEREREVLRLMVQGTHPKRSASAFESLTQAEFGVARLAAAGVSNCALAALRGSSARTVANQLASVYRKLGISGRRELRARMAELRTMLGDPAARANLSARESQVLLFANLGLSNKGIAYALEVSVSAVSKYLQRARKKLTAPVSSQ